MAAEIGKEVADWWGEAYGAESEIAHPRGASLAIQLAGANVRLGPIYDADLVLSTLYMLMLETARMASIGSHTVDLINEGKLEGAWTSKLQDLTSRVSAWKESAERRIAASGGLPIPEPPEQAAPTGQS